MVRIVHCTHKEHERFVLDWFLLKAELEGRIWIPAAQEAIGI